MLKLIIGIGLILTSAWMIIPYEQLSGAFLNSVISFLSGLLPLAFLCMGITLIWIWIEEKKFK